MALDRLLQGQLAWLRDNTNLSVLKLDNIEFRDLKFPNKESYRGGWKESRPEGEGCYTWADGSAYEGAWHTGLKHGWGKYCWPNSACYQGEWRDGFMQGYGTFESPDGARYVGNWLGNLKHGIGKKVYANGDSYEGLWRNGKAEGPGRYVWHNGNQYDGEWRSGKMHGQGTLKWITGERYDGEWLEGQENGVGVFTWRDASTYEGFWEAGKKTGVGVFRPAPNTAMTPGGDFSTRSPPPVGDAAASAVDDPPPRSPLGSPMAADAPLDSPAAGSRPRRDMWAQDAPRGGGGAGGGTASELVFVCQYDHGKLVHEEALSTQDLELIFGPAKQAIDKRRRLRRGRKRQVRLGETIYKGHRSYDLMLNLQLGIRYTITTLNKIPPQAKMTPEHYTEKVWLKFPREGSEVTPPHPSGDFKWKDYCPTTFKRLRGLFGIDNSQYILSICGDQALREMPSPGKSGSVFFISHDDQFMIKTMHKEEIKLLLSMLPKYMKHVEQNPETLLTRFYGVHRVKPSHGRKVRFVVMNNVFRTDMDLHRKYDLKGSTYGRTAGPKLNASAIRKDLDLDINFKTDVKLRSRLMQQLQNDCGFLEVIRVMDYSLLMGVHCRSCGETSASAHNTDKEDNDAYESAEGEGSEEGSEDASEECSPFAQPAASCPSLFDMADDGRPRRRASSGLSVAPTSDTDMDVTRSMHSMTIEQMSPREARSPSFSLKGLTWRSRRSSQQQLAPALGQHPGQTLQPPTSAQITPRLQPSLMPTPRLIAAAAAASPPVHPRPNGSRFQPQPQPAMGAVLRAAMAAEASAAGDADAAEEEGAAGAADEAVGGTAPEAQQQQQEQSGAAAQGAEAAEEQHQLPQLVSGLPSWRADAVQLPEQQMGLLPDGLPASPSGNSDAAAAAAGGKLRTSALPALGAILEQPGSPEQGSSTQELSAEQQAAAGEAATSATSASGTRSSGQTPPAAGLLDSRRSPFSSSLPPEAAAEAAAGSPDSSSDGSADAGTPVSQADRVGSCSLMLPVPGSVPRIALHSTPQQLLPQPDSGDWQQYAQSVSDASVSGGGSGRRSMRRRREGSPDSEASSPVSSYLRRRTLPLSGDAAAGVPDSPLSLRSGRASAPATARAPLNPAGASSATPAATSAVHRLAQEGGRDRAPPGGAAGLLHPSSLARTSSAPAGRILQCVLAEERRRQAQQGPRGGNGIVVAREASLVDLTSAEAVAVVGRINTRLSRKVTDRLVQDLLKLARYRMVGAMAPTPSARQCRMPTTVLAARHMRRSSSGTPHHDRHSSLEEEHLPGGGGGASFGAAGGGMLVAAAAAGGGGGCAEDVAAAAAAAAPRLGMGVPAVAVSQQAGQGAEEVVLFFGIIDFLQEYNMRKMLEHSFKAVVQDGKTISVVEPRTYAKRFLKCMDKVFPPPQQQA